MKRVVSLCLVWLASVAGAQEGAIQRGVVVQPESVTVGDPFRVVVRVRAPLGSVINFPAGPDTADKVEPLDRVVVVQSEDSTAVEQTATWRLAASLTRPSLPAPPGPAAVGRHSSCEARCRGPKGSGWS